MEEKIKSDFFIALSQRICDLKQQNFCFSLTSFFPKQGNVLEIGIVKKEEKRFQLTFDKEGVFSLENKEYCREDLKPTFRVEEMIDYLLVLVNGAQIHGTLMTPEFTNFEHLENIS